MKTKRGSIYILTLVAAIILMGLVMGFSYRLMVFRQNSRTHTDIEQAYIYAELGLRHALYLPKITADWRVMLNNGVWLNQIKMGDATYTVSGIDTADNNLANNDSDPVTLTSTATVHGVSRTLQMRIQQNPSELLQYGLVSGQTTSVWHQSQIYGTIFSNMNLYFDTNNPLLIGNVQVHGSVTRPERVTGTILTGQAVKSIPSWNSVAPYYLERGTVVTYVQNMNSHYLMPHLNTIDGRLNAQGLYIIHCQGRDIYINHIAIYGTLILTDPGPNSKIEGTVYWRPYRSDYPAFMTNGNMMFNFYYDSFITGLIYIQGNLKATGRTELVGTTIATGEVRFENLARLYQDRVGSVKSFVSDELTPMAGSWREVMVAGN